MKEYKPFVSDEESWRYHQHPCVSSSELRRIVKGATPRHIIHRRDNPKEPTYPIGTACHALVLDQKGEFVVAQHDGRTKAGMAEREEFGKDLPHAVILNKREAKIATGMAESVLKHPEAKKIIETAVCEASVYWKEQSPFPGPRDAGPWYKGRLDIINDTLGVAADLKGYGDASYVEFCKEISRKRYDIQAYHYLRGLGVATGRVDYVWKWIVVETDGAFEVVVYTLDALPQKTHDDWMFAAKLMAEAHVKTKGFKDKSEGYTDMTIVPDDIWLPN